MSLLASAVDMLSGGGLTGLVSGAIGAYTKIKEKKLDQEQRRYEMSYEVKMHRLQFEADQYMADKELLISRQQGADTLLNSAIQAEARLSDAGLPWWVRSIRTLFRPALTIFLWVGTFAIAYSALPVTVVTQGIALTFQQGASAATGFWFGSRAVGGSTDR